MLKKLRTLGLKVAGINNIIDAIHRNIVLERINVSINKGQTSAILREIDANNPRTWEFSGFSQNGEDGIIEYLIKKIKSPNQYFVEIGCSDGIQNNTTWQAVVKGWEGIMIDGNEKAIIECTKYIKGIAPQIDCCHYFVNLENISEIQQKFKFSDPDLFSLDIDGNDYHIMNYLFDHGFRPKVVVVEYNSALGPDVPTTIKYDKDFVYSSPLNYGCSISAWKNLFSVNGYRFITVDSKGVNAFFIEAAQFKTEFINQNISSLQFVENRAQYREHGNKGWEFQSQLIKSDLFEILQ